MKKIIIMALTCMLILVGCSSDSKNEIDAAKTEKLGDILSVKVEAIEHIYGTNIEAPVTSMMTRSIYNGKVYDVVVEITNISKEEQKIEDVLACQILFEDEKQSTKLKFESADRTELLDSYTLKEEESVIAHIYTSSLDITTVAKDMELIYTVDSTEYVSSLKPSDFVREKTDVTYGETLTTSNGLSIELQESIETKEISPSDPSGAYTYYKVQSQSQTFVGLKVLVTNNGSEEIDLKNVLGIRLVQKDDSENYVRYAGGSILETVDHKKLQTSGTLAPGEQNVLYCLLSESDSSLEKIVGYKIDTSEGTYYISK